jgi:hypothetical protein
LNSTLTVTKTHTHAKLLTFTVPRCLRDDVDVITEAVTVTYRHGASGKHRGRCRHSAQDCKGQRLVEGGASGKHRGTLSGAVSEFGYW